MFTSVGCLKVLCVLLVVVSRVKLTKVLINPMNTVLALHSSLNVTCVSDDVHNSSGCQWRVRADHNDRDFRIIKANNMEITNARDMSNMTKKYVTSYENNYTCSLNLSGMSTGRFVIGCRHYVVDSWVYNYTVVSVVNASFLENVTNSSSITHCETTELIHKYDDTNVTVICPITLPGPTRACQMAYGKAKRNNTMNVTSCHYTIPYLNASESGLVWCDPGAKNRIIVLALNITRKPKCVLLHHDITTRYKVGDNISATCIIQGARPDPNITWYIGCDIQEGYVILNKSHEDWEWPWSLHNITQTITIAMKQEYHNKSLKCRVQQNDAVITRDFILCLAGATSCISDTTPLTTMDIWMVIAIIAIITLVVMTTAFIVYSKCINLTTDNTDTIMILGDIADTTVYVDNPATSGPNENRHQTLAEDTADVGEDEPEYHYIDPSECMPASINASAVSQTSTNSKHVTDRTSNQYEEINVFTTVDIPESKKNSIYGFQA